MYLTKYDLGKRRSNFFRKYNKPYSLPCCVVLMPFQANLHVLDVPVGPEGDGVAQHRPGVTVSAQTGPHQKSAHGVVHQPK